MTEVTDLGFPKGRVAKKLRSILYPDLNDHEVEAIVVCLMAHLLVEERLNRVLYRWLKQDAPKPPMDQQIEDADGKLRTAIVKLDFAKKYSLVEPFFAARFPSEAAIPWKINDLRNDIFHGRAIKDAKFNGQPISDEATVEQVFLSAQCACMQLDKFDEIIDTPHALAERWSKRLVELREPLF